MYTWYAPLSFRPPEKSPLPSQMVAEEGQASIVFTSDQSYQENHSTDDSMWRSQDAL